MNMISTGAFQTEVDASKKTKTLVSELVSAWEKKNAKVARAGGVSLMALSLAACGSSSDDAATVTPTVPTTPTTPVTPSTTVKLANDGGSFSLATTVDGVSVPASTAAKIYINDNEPGDAYSFTLDAAAAGSGTLTMEFADAGDTVTLAADSSFGNFTTLEIKNGTVDITAVTTASNVTSLVINSGVKATVDQIKTLTSITGTGDVIAVANTQADIDALIAHFNTIGATLNTTFSAASGSTLTTADLTAGNTNVAAETDGNAAADVSTTSETLTLTSTGDSLTGGAGNDTINGVLVGAGGVGSTAQPGDVVDGGAGTDTLNISATGDVDGHTLAAIRTSNVEKVLISNFDTDTAKTLTVDASLFDGVTTVGLSASGANGDTAFSGMLSIMDAEMNGGGDLTMTYHATAIAGTADVQNVLLQNTTGKFVANGVETISITSSLLNNTLSQLDSDTATTVKVAGDKNLTITAEMSANIANIKSIDAAAMTGNLTVRNNDTTTNATLGSGDDVYRTDSAVAATYQIDGGAGEDEIEVDAATVLDTALETARYVNFEALQINNVAAASTNSNQNMSLLSGIDTITVSAQDSTDGNADAVFNTSLTNVVDGSAIKLESLSTAEDNNTLTVGITAQSAADNSTNTLSLVMGSATAASGATVLSATNAKAFATLTANNAETITITSQGGANSLGTLTSADLTTITALGSQNLTIGNIGSATALATVNASDMTGTAAFVMGGTNASTTAGTYTGTANADTLVGGSKADTLNGGAGIDTLTGGAGANVLNGGAGADILNASATADETLNGGTGDDNIKFATANFTSADTVSGGDGADKITMTNAATIVDADFTNVTGVETLTLEAAGTDVDLGTLADAGGIRTVVSTAGANNDDINMVKDFASDVTIQIGQGDDTITAAATYAGNMTVDLSTLGDADDIDGNDTITGGAGSDTLLIKSTGTAVTAAELAGVSKIETIKLSNDLTTGAITLADTNIADGATLTVDGTAIISDGNVLTVVGTAETNGSLTVLGGAGADAITGTASDLGDTLNGNGGNDQFNFATANLTKLDTVDGGAGTKDKIVTSDGGTLVDADFTGVSNVELVTFGAGTTVTLDTLADAAGLTSFTHGAGTNKVTIGNTTTSVSGYDNDYTVNLVASTKDTIDGTLYAGKMTVAFANMDHIDAGAVITGGTGTNDTLSINQTNTALTSAELANIKGIENFTLLNDEATAAITLNNNNAAAGKSIKVDGSAMITTNALTISAANEADGFVTIIGGTAGDTLTMSISGAGGDTITAGSGDDTINVAVANYTSLDTVDGGAGTADDLALSTGGTLSDVSFGGTTNVEKLTTANADTTLILGAKAAAAGIKTITTLTGSNTNSVTLGADFTNDATVVLVDNTDTIQATSYTGKATVTIGEDNLAATDTITGGSGVDTLTITFDGEIATDHITAAEMANVTKVDVIKSASNVAGKLVLADANTASGATITVDNALVTSAAFTLDASAETNGSLTYTGGGGIDTVTGGAKNDTIGGGAGADVITGGKGADSITGGTGADVFTYTAANQSTTNSTDTIVDYVTGTDKFAFTLDFNTQVNALTFDATVNTAAAGSAAVASGLSAAIGQATYDTTNSQLVVNANADNLISTADYVVNATAAATAANSIVEGDINFTITGGSAGDTIVAGGGADTINGGAGDDAITGGAGADTLNGGAGADTYTIGVGAGIDNIDVTAATDIDKIVTDAVSSDDYFQVTNFAVGNDLIDYNGALESDNGTKTAVQGNEGGAIADIASIATAKTSAHVSTAMTNDIIDNFLAGTKTLAELKAAAIVSLDDGTGAAGVTAGLDTALSDDSVVIVFTIDNEDTAIWRFDNEDTVANTVVASELELIGIVHADLINNTEMATIMI